VDVKETQEEPFKCRIKKCHYFNNKLACPFNELGCMFAHELSEMCKFNKKCKAYLCPNQRSKEKLDIEEVNEVEMYDTENDGQSEDDQVGCTLCCCTFLDQEELKYHMQDSHKKQQQFMYRQTFQFLICY
jgi:hypothetical protein